MKKTPLAVTFGWFLLGALTAISFDFWLAELVGIAIALVTGYKLLKRALVIICCMRKRMREVKRTGEDPGSCFVGIEP